MEILITLCGVTFLFGLAQVNGTMDALAEQALRLCHGRAALLPLMIFLLTALLASVGPGAVLATALVAPFAMQTRVSPFLIALMVGNGANAGNMSPFSTVGVIVTGLMTRYGLGGHEFRVWFFHAAAHILVAAAAYLIFGGLKLWRDPSLDTSAQAASFGPSHWRTAAILGAWILSVVVWRLPLGYSAFAAGLILLALDYRLFIPAVKKMPWKIIALVVTISTAVGFLERSGALAWFENLIARVSTPQTIHPLIAFVTGIISAYSSTSGVVLPAFLPLAKGLAAHLPGTDPFALSVSIVIGASLVDVSPLSTLGALCIAAAPKEVDGVRLFRSLMIWGFAMAFAGAAFCWIFSPWFAL